MLKRVSIQNFKSLKDVTLDLQKVNLLIGPNNSGKTNFLKALEFFSKRLEYFVNEKNSDNSFKNSDENLIRIEIVKDHYDDVFQYWDYEKFEFVFNRMPTKKQLSLWSSDSIDEPMRNDTIFAIDDKGFWNSISNEVFTNEPRKATVYTRPSRVFEEKRRDFLGYIIYKPDPNKLDKAAPIGQNERLVNADASNLVGFLDLMLSKYRKTVFSIIENDLHTCISEFDEIKLDDIAPTDELKKQHGDKSFKRIGLSNSKQDNTYWANELSEGTLYFLALLCIIHQPNPPKLLLLEEPEKGIHPRRIKEVINFIFRLADDKDIQIIMTTHSPIVLDMFKDMPESVFIFDKNNDEGVTTVKNLQRDVIEPDTKRSEELGIEPPHYTDSLGDSWTVGFLGGVPK
jgi:AAA15 family ATPase/GTPase